MIGVFMVPYFTVSLFVVLCVLVVEVLVFVVLLVLIVLFFDGDKEDIGLVFLNFRVVLGIAVPIFVSEVGFIIVTPVI